MRKSIAIILFLLLIDCALSGFIAEWRSWFWQSVADKQLHSFFIYILEFTVVALVDCFIVGYMGYRISMFALDQRSILTDKALTLNNHTSIEGGNQRVQEDCMSYPTIKINLIVGLIRSVIMIVVFGYILLSHLSAIYILVPVLYSVIGTGVAGYIAHPLIALNYVNQVVEAKFRQLLLPTVYNEVYQNNYNLFKTTKYLSYFQSFYNQITVIVPYVGLSSLYFSGKITFGIFMQVASSMIEIINNLSYLITSFNDINKLLSCRKRLKEINVI